MKIAESNINQLDQFRFQLHEPLFCFTELCCVLIETKERLVERENFIGKSGNGKNLWL